MYAVQQVCSHCSRSISGTENLAPRQKYFSLLNKMNPTFVLIYGKLKMTLHSFKIFINYKHYKKASVILIQRSTNNPSLLIIHNEPFSNRVHLLIMFVT